MLVLGAAEELVPNPDRCNSCDHSFDAWCLCRDRRISLCAPNYVPRFPYKVCTWYIYFLLPPGRSPPREVEEYVDDGPDEEPRVVVEDTTLRLEAAGGVIVCTRQAPARSAAPRLLCRLADTGHVDTASYALKFLF